MPRCCLLLAACYLLLAAADAFQYHAELIALCVKEAGKTLPDSYAEVREAVDFLRYYAQLALSQMAQPQTLPGFTGESNELSLQGRGVLSVSVRGIFRWLFLPVRSLPRW